MALAWTTRPSELLGIDDAWVSWCVDEAVLTFGRQVEAAMEAAVTAKDKPEQREAKRKRVLEAMLGEKMVSTQAQRYRDPAELF
jgi:hemerythrin superfamily protein